MDRPEVDDVTGIPPTVAIEQRMSQGGRRSTVATMTEIYHYLRLLYSKVGVQHCPGCGEPIVSQTPAAMLEEIGRRFGGRNVTVAAPVVLGRKGFHREVLTKLKKQGVRQVARRRPHVVSIPCRRSTASGSTTSTPSSAS